MAQWPRTLHAGTVRTEPSANWPLGAMMRVALQGSLATWPLGEWSATAPRPNGRALGSPRLRSQLGHLATWHTSDAEWSATVDWQLLDNQPTPQPLGGPALTTTSHTSSHKMAGRLSEVWSATWPIGCVPSAAWLLRPGTCVRRRPAPVQSLSSGPLPVGTTAPDRRWPAQSRSLPPLRQAARRVRRDHETAAPLGAQRSPDQS